jgi:hypothetical protein
MAQAIVRGERLQQPHEDRDSSVMNGWMARWVENVSENRIPIRRDYRRLNRSLPTLARFNERDELVREWRGPAIVLGSGPSLDEAAPLLRDWRGGLFACGSNAKVAARYGRRPDFIGVFDAGETVLNQLRGQSWKGTTLLTNPAVDPALLRWWIRHGWDRRYYLQLHEGHLWFEETVPLMYPWVHCSILNAGCTSNNLVEMAWFMGYSPIFLVGVDFSFTPFKARCDYYDRPWSVHRYIGDYDKHGTPGMRWEWESRNPLNPWVKVPAPKPDESRDFLFDLGDGRLTFEEQIEYKLGLFAVWSIDATFMVNCSYTGAISEDDIPRAPFEQVVRQQGAGFEHLRWSREKIREKASEVFGKLEAPVMAPVSPGEAAALVAAEPSGETPPTA